MVIPNDVSSVAFADDGRLATGSSDGTVRIWDADGNLLKKFDDDERVSSVAFAIDGRLGVGSGNGTARIWSSEYDMIYKIRWHLAHRSGIRG